MVSSTFALLLFSAIGNLQSAPVERDTVAYGGQDKVVVSAPRPEDRETAFVTVLKADDFNDRHVSLADVLAETPGMVVRRLGGHGAYSTMSIRGCTAENVQVYLDDVLLNASIGGAVDFGRIPLDNIEKVEIFRGTMPVGMGGSGMGGVIKITTRGVSRAPDYTGILTAGTFGYGAAMAMTRFTAGPCRTMVLVNAEHAENNYPFTVDGVEKIRSNARYRVINPQVKTQYRTGRLILNVNDNARITRKGLPALADSPRQTELAGLSGWNNMLKADGNFALTSGGGTKLLADAFWTVDRERYLDTLTIHDPDRPRESEFSSQYDFDASTGMQTLGGALELRHPAGRSGVLSYKMSYAYDTYSYDDALGSGRDNSLVNNRHTVGLTAAGTFYLLDERVAVTATGHQGIIRADYHGLRKYDPTPPETTFSSSYPSLYLGLNTHINSRVLVKSNAGYGYRIPSNFELFGNTGTHLGNTELKPERSWSVDIGTGIHSADNRKRIELSIFGVRYRDMIQAYMFSQDLIKHVNYGQTGNYGMEASWHFQGAPYDFTYDGTMTLQRPTNYTVKYADPSDPDGPYYGNLIPNQARVQFSNRAGIRIKRFTVFAEYLHMGLNYRDQMNNAYWPARHVWNIGTGWRYGDYGLTLTARNIFNASYMDLIGYPQPGRQFVVKAEYRRRILAGTEK